MLRISEYQISLKLMKLEGRECEKIAITEFEPKEPHQIIIIIIIIIIIPLRPGNTGLMSSGG